MIDWLKHSTTFPKLYWKPRDEPSCLAAVGPGKLAPFYIAPFASMESALWKSFPRKKSVSFAQVKTGDYVPTEEILRKPNIKQVRYAPTFSEWERCIFLAKKAISCGSFQKIVLARKVHIELASAIDPLSLLASILGKNSLYGFYFSPKKGCAFLGASPERFLQVKGSHIETEALAATRTAGKENELLEKRKEQLEFYYVEKGIQETLFPYVQNLQISRRKIQKSHNLFHLKKTFQAELLEQKSVDSLIKNLHPTAAILGENNPDTWHFLQKHEPFERGLYAGIFGRKESHHTDFCVPIRSCLVDGSSLHLFSGVGVVLGSDPQQEWQELNDKLEPYLKSLCLSL